MLQHLDAYFAAEKTESLVFLGVGLLACVAAGLVLWRVRDPLFRGFALPLLIVGLVQVGVGATVHARTDAQLATLKAQYQAAPAEFKAQESARMKTVRASFMAYKAVEIAFIVIGLGLAFARGAHRFWRGLGLGMLVQGALMLPADLLAEERADMYLAQLEALP
jgi:hypothetical protein